MGILDWFNLVAYVLMMWNVADADESYVYLYNRLTIFLKDV